MRLSDCFYFVQGYVRYGLVKVFNLNILRSHISEQIVMRVMSADRKCLGDGRCKICGCHTPALFYADKACDKPCYPRMMGRKEWRRFLDEGMNEDWIIVRGRFKKIKEVYE